MCGIRRLRGTGGVCGPPQAFAPRMPRAPDLSTFYTGRPGGPCAGWGTGVRGPGQPHWRQRVRRRARPGTSGARAALRDALARRANGSDRRIVSPGRSIPDRPVPPGDGFLTIDTFTRSGGLGVLRVVGDRVLLELRAQRLARDSEHRRRARLVALADAQRVFDRHLLQLGQRAHGARGEWIDRRGAEVAACERPGPERLPAHLRRQVLRPD